MRLVKWRSNEADCAMLIKHWRVLFRGRGVCSCSSMHANFERIMVNGVVHGIFFEFHFDDGLG